MAARTPEGVLKGKCRKLALRLKLIYWNIEGKGVNGIPDTIVGKYPRGSGVIILEAKREGKEPTEQQEKRIRELRESGQDADWYDSYERFCELIGYDLSL
jgi:hypothetical protein